MFNTASSLMVYNHFDIQYSVKLEESKRAYMFPRKSPSLGALQHH